jgi:geranylgeranyl reductase family protein
MGSGIRSSNGSGQVPLDGHARFDWDVTVIGAGPAGCVAAAHLSALGYRTLLLDRKSFPREKVCGDGLIPDALRALSRIGLEREVRRRGHEISRISFFSASRVEVDVPGDFVTLRRRELDTLLAREAVSRGTTFCEGEVAALEEAPDGSIRCRIADDDRVVRSRFALVATGVSTRLLRGHGVVREEDPNAIALRCYVRSPVQLDRLMISFDRSVTPGYAWIFPLGEGEYNVGCGVFNRRIESRRFNLRSVFERFSEDFPVMRDLMDRATEQSPLKGAPLRCGLTGVAPEVPGRVLAIGETIGATYPFSGEGVGKAMETGEIAARTVDEAFRTGRLDVIREFGARVEADLGKMYRGYRVAEEWMSKAWLLNFIARRARRSRFMRKAIAGVLNETIDPRPIFSVRGIVRSLIS